MLDKPIPTGIALIDEIQALKRDMNAVVLAHYYQDDDIQDIADFIGDSLDLSRKAAQTDCVLRRKIYGRNGKNCLAEENRFVARFSRRMLA
jgi:hypothetical protein